MMLKVKIFLSILLYLIGTSLVLASSNFKTEVLTPSMLTKGKIWQLFKRKDEAYITTCFQENNLHANTICTEGKYTLPMLIILCEKGTKLCHNIVMSLIQDKNFDPSIKNSCGETLLHFAVFSGNLELTNFILKKNISINHITTDSKNTPCHIIFNNLLKDLEFDRPYAWILARLIKKGGDLFLANTFGERPIDLLSKIPTFSLVRRLFPIKKVTRPNLICKSHEQTVKWYLELKELKPYMLIRIFEYLVHLSLKDTDTKLPHEKLQDLDLFKETSKKNPHFANFIIKAIQFYFMPHKKIIFPNRAPKSTEYPVLSKEEEEIRKEIFTKTFYKLAVKKDHYNLSNREFSVFINLEKLRKTNYPKLYDFIIKLKN